MKTEAPCLMLPMAAVSFITTWLLPKPPGAAMGKRQLRLQLLSLVPRGARQNFKMVH